MNSTPIIDVPPRLIHPATSRLTSPATTPSHAPSGEDELRSLAQQIVQHDPALALLLARAGERVRKS